MIIQESVLVKGGLDSLKGKIDEMHLEGKIPIGIADDDGDFVVVFKEKNFVELTTRLISGFHPLESKIADMKEEGWIVSGIGSEDGKHLVVFIREVEPIYTGGSQPANSAVATIGCGDGQSNNLLDVQLQLHHGYHEIPNGSIGTQRN